MLLTNKQRNGARGGMPMENIHLVRNALDSIEALRSSLPNRSGTSEVGGSNSEDFGAVFSRLIESLNAVEKELSIKSQSSPEEGEVSGAEVKLADAVLEEATDGVGQGIIARNSGEPDFKIKYRQEKDHPITGQAMYSALLAVDGDFMHKSGPYSSRAEVRDDLDLKIAEVLAKHTGETKTVKVNHDTERVQVSPDGARLNLNKLSLQELLDDEAKSNGAA